MTAAIPERLAALLEALADVYRDDVRVRAVVVFGSMARGNADDLSDVDLDIVLTDGAEFDVASEVEALLARLSKRGFQRGVAVTSGDSLDVVMADLTEFSVRYHRLVDTSPNIVDSARIVAGTLSHHELVAAGLANSTPSTRNLDAMFAEVLRYGVGLQKCSERNTYWLGVELSRRIQMLLLEIAVLSRGGQRIWEIEGALPPTVEESVRAIGAGADSDSIRSSVDSFIDVISTSLDELSNGKLHLAPSQREIVAALVRKRTASND